MRLCFRILEIKPSESWAEYPGCFQSWAKVKFTSDRSLGFSTQGFIWLSADFFWRLCQQMQFPSGPWRCCHPSLWDCCGFSQTGRLVRSVFAQRLEIHVASSPHPSAICHQIAGSLLGPASADEEDLLSDELRANKKLLFSGDIQF